MQLPSVPGLSSGLATGLTSLASLAAFVRDRLAEAAPKSGTALLSRRDEAPARAGRTGSADDAVRHLVIAATAPFAATSYARARLLRQMHASGLLTQRETEQAEHYLGVAQ